MIDNFENFLYNEDSLSCFILGGWNKTGFFAYLGKEINGDRHEKKRQRN